MKLVHALAFALIAFSSIHAQDVTPATPPAPAQESTPSQPVPAAPAETVQPAIPEGALPSSTSPSFTQDQVRQIETALKKQMLLVGMGSGVLGLLIGMMIGRKTAPRAKGSRY